MGSYLGRHAELYDLIYAEKPYQAEAEFVHFCLQRYGSGNVTRLLELACGSGSHAFALEKLGYEIIAIDYSKEMINVARNKAIVISSKVDFRNQDMRSLNLPEGQFDAVICLFDSIGYVVTNNAIKETFQGIYQHLKPNGLFIFEFWHAGAMLRHYEPLRIRRFKSLKGDVLRISETSIDYNKQICNVTYNIYEFNRDGTYCNFEETQVNRFFLIQEMSVLLTENGFVPLKWFSGFNECEDISENTWHIVAVSQRINDE
jgi:SAM-dependent methyltransferase